jgi:class 3 adenylate cyclase
MGREDYAALDVETLRAVYVELREIARYTMGRESADSAESAVAALIADLEAFAWKALCDGNDDLAEGINRELVAARTDFAEFIGGGD